MKKKKYFIGIIGILMVMMFIGCNTSKSEKEENVNKDSAVKSPIIENLELEIDNKKIELVNSKNGIDISKDLLKQIGGNVESELNGVWTEKQLEVLAGFGNEKEIGRLVIKNLGNKEVKINGMQIGEERKKIEKKWKKDKLETISIENSEVIAYGELCEMECKFEDDKLSEIIYKYNPVEDLLSIELENSDEEDDDWEDTEEEERKLVYPSKFNFSKEEEKEYAAVIEKYEEKYGKWIEGEYYEKGVCFLKFLDLKGDDTVQLMIGYSSEESINDKVYLDYSFDIWDLEDGKAIKVDSGECFRRDGDYKSFLILENNTKKYVVSSESMPECEMDRMYHGYKDGKFEVVRYEKKDGVYYAIDGREVSREEYEDQLWIYKKDSQDEFCLNGYEMDYAVELWNEICFVKEALHMEKD